MTKVLLDSSAGVEPTDVVFTYMVPRLDIMTNSTAAANMDANVTRDVIQTQSSFLEAAAHLVNGQYGDRRLKPIMGGIATGQKGEKSGLGTAGTLGGLFMRASTGMLYAVSTESVYPNPDESITCHPSVHSVKTFLSKQCVADSAGKKSTTKTSNGVAFVEPVDDCCVPLGHKHAGQVRPENEPHKKNFSIDVAVTDVEGSFYASCSVRRVGPVRGIDELGTAVDGDKTALGTWVKKSGMRTHLTYGYVTRVNEFDGLNKWQYVVRGKAIAIVYIQCVLIVSYSASSSFIARSLPSFWETPTQRAEYPRVPVKLGEVEKEIFTSKYEPFDFPRADILEAVKQCYVNPAGKTLYKPAQALDIAEALFSNNMITAFSASGEALEALLTMLASAFVALTCVRWLR